MRNEKEREKILKKSFFSLFVCFMTGRAVFEVAITFNKAARDRRKEKKEG